MTTPASFEYPPAEDHLGNALRPGDWVRFKVYPCEYAEGQITVGPGTVLLIKHQAWLYELVSNEVTKLGDSDSTPQEREARQREVELREATEHEAREHEARGHEAREHEAREREARGHETREHEAREHEAREHEAREREAREHEAALPVRLTWVDVVSVAGVSAAVLLALGLPALYAGPPVAGLLLLLLLWFGILCVHAIFTQWRGLQQGWSVAQADDVIRKFVWRVVGRPIAVALVAAVVAAVVLAICYGIALVWEPVTTALDTTPWWVFVIIVLLVLILLVTAFK